MATRGRLRGRLEPADVRAGVPLVVVPTYGGGEGRHPAGAARTRVGLCAAGRRAEAEPTPIANAGRAAFVRTPWQRSWSGPERPGAADRTLARLIDYMAPPRRHAPRGDDVGRGVRLTEGYLEIQRLRMEARLRDGYRRRRGPARQLCPPAALRTLVENAIKHGLVPRERARVAHRSASGGRRLVVASPTTDGWRGRRTRSASPTCAPGMARPLWWRRLAAPASAAEGGNDGNVRCPRCAARGGGVMSARRIDAGRLARW